MNRLKKMWCRIYQRTLFAASFFRSWKQPELLEGEGCFSQMADFMTKKGFKHPLVVCSKTARAREPLASFFKSAEESGIKTTVYDGVHPDPTVFQAEEGFALFVYENCDCILAFGGGSAIDCAKAIGVRVARPEKSLKQLKGLLKVKKAVPPLFAVPTTAGTGSECTIAAVVTDDDTHEKFAICDFALTPSFAVIDPALTLSVPPSVTAATGMDALTHAVEAYIGRSCPAQAAKYAEDAICLIFENIVEATRNGKNMQARANMQEAAYLAGLAFTRAYVGYVHALAHALGGQYGISHGLANAVLLPEVLKKYGPAAHKKLAKLAALLNLSSAEDADEFAANKFIHAIEELNGKLNIPKTFGGQINPEDIPRLARRAEKEGNPLYPVPRLWDEEEFEDVLQSVSK